MHHRAAQHSKLAAMNKNDVKSAKRVLQILHFFAERRSPATLSEISTALGFPKSSALGLLETLESEGYAHQSANGYYLTRRWLMEAQSVAEHDWLIQRVRPELVKLAQKWGETLILAQRSGTRVVYLDVVEPDRIVRFTACVGQTKPIHAAASGRALLAGMAVTDRERLIARLPFDRYTDATPISATELHAVLEKEIRQGWHVNLGEHQGDTLSIAVPLVLHGAQYALVVGAPLDRARSRSIEIGGALKEVSRTLSEAFDNSYPA